MRLIIGMAAAFVAGVLMAPKSGKENREELKREANKFKFKAEDQLNEILDSAKTQYNKILTDLRIERENEELIRRESVNNN